MKTLCAISLLILFAAPVAAEVQTLETKARTALDAALEGDYDTFSSLSNEAVRQAVSKEALDSIAATLELRFGSFVEVLEVEPTSRDGYDVFVYSLDFERAVVKMMIAIDADSLVSGLRIVGADQKVEWSPPEYVEPSSFREEEVSVGAEGFPLPGTLSLPGIDEPIPAVVLLHGSGPNDRDETIGPNKIFKDLAWGLASRGIAVLRYEKRTKALPMRFDTASATLEDEVIDDAVAAVAFLRERPEIDASRIFVLGHSLGGLAAPYVSRRDSELAGIVVIAGPGRPMLDILAYQIEHLAKLSGKWSDDTKAEVARIEGVARRGRAGDDVSDEAIMGVPAGYWLDLDLRDAPGVAAATKSPLLLIQGGRDYQVTMDCFDIWKERLADKPFASLVVFEDLNHLMIKGDGQSTPGEYQEKGHVDERVVRRVAEWIGER